MLRAYEYSENVDLSINNKESAISKKEILLAKQAVTHIQKRYAPKKRENDYCRFCGYGQTDIFYNKWNEAYKRCSECGSIYCDCTQEQLHAYINDEELIDFRISEEYQQDAALRRKDSWEETVKWLKFRSFRYLMHEKKLVITDYGNRYKDFIEIIKNAPFVSEYYLRESILSQEYPDAASTGTILADVLLYMNVLQQEQRPEQKLCELHEQLRKDGLLVISSRAGSGFDILTLQENHEYIYPYEHITLPSVKGLIRLLEKTGYDVLEVTTPGSMDVKYVYNNRQNIKDRCLFLKTMIREQGERTLQEFQRFLQKNCMSSYVQIIARRI